MNTMHPPTAPLLNYPKAASSGNLLNASKMKGVFAAPRSDFCHVHFLVLCIIPGKASFDQGLPLFSHVLLCSMLCIRRDLTSVRNLSRLLGSRQVNVLISVMFIALFFASFLERLPFLGHCLPFHMSCFVLVLGSCLAPCLVYCRCGRSLCVARIKRDLTNVRNLSRLLGSPQVNLTHGRTSL